MISVALLLPLGLHVAAPSVEACGPIPAFIEAFNEKDVDGMTALLHPRAGWHYVGDGRIFIEAKGADKIRESMEGYFKAHPNTRSSIGPCQVNGPFISFVETASWPGDDGEQRSQSASAVYRVTDGKIREAYYFPAVKTDWENNR